jgi:hypothetical protein
MEEKLSTSKKTVVGNVHVGHILKFVAQKESSHDGSLLFFLIRNISNFKRPLNKQQSISVYK